MVPLCFQCLRLFLDELLHVSRRTEAEGTRCKARLRPSGKASPEGGSLLLPVLAPVSILFGSIWNMCPAQSNNDNSLTCAMVLSTMSFVSIPTEPGKAVDKLNLDITCTGCELLFKVQRAGHV